MTPAQAVGSPVTSPRLRNRAATAGTRWRCLANQPALKIPGGAAAAEEEVEEEARPSPSSSPSPSPSCPSSSTFSPPRPKSSAAPASGSEAETLLQGGRCAERRYSATGAVDWVSPRSATRASGGVAISGGYASIFFFERGVEKRSKRGKRKAIDDTDASSSRRRQLIDKDLFSILRSLITTKKGDARHEGFPERALRSRRGRAPGRKRRLGEREREREREPLLLSDGSHSYFFCSVSLDASLFFFSFLKFDVARSSPSKKKKKNSTNKKRLRGDISPRKS